MTPRTIDVSALPRAAFGSRSIGWWGTVAFIVIEGTTLAVAATSYLYLRRNSLEWPPQPLQMPDLLIPTVGLLLLLLAILPLRAAAAAADRADLDGVGRALAAAAALGLLILAVRALEFGALNVRWDANAYGSVAWLVLGLHTALLLADVIETIAIGAIFWLGRVEPKHLPDVEDAAVYQYFLSAVWVPLYLLIFIGPRLL